MSYLIVKIVSGRFPILCQVRDEKRGNRIVQVLEEELGQIQIVETQFETRRKAQLNTTDKTNAHNPPKISWQRLRSDIYIRDNGICWVCNKFVPLPKYDLGHIVDRCNNGYDYYDNLAVMHKSCNGSKPYHRTLEEALKWKLTSFLPQPKHLKA